MLFLDIALILCGIAFCIFGVLIRFLGRYDLINGWDSGEMSERFAQRVGLAELIGGAVFIILGAVASAVHSVIFSIAVFLISAAALVAALVLMRIFCLGGGER